MSDLIPSEVLRIYFVAFVKSGTPYKFGYFHANNIYLYNKQKWDFILPTSESLVL